MNSIEKAEVFMKFFFPWFEGKSYAYSKADEMSLKEDFCNFFNFDIDFFKDRFYNEVVHAKMDLLDLVLKNEVSIQDGEYFLKIK